MIEKIHAAHPDCEIILQVMSPQLDRPEGNSGYRPNYERYQEIYRQVGKEKGFLLARGRPSLTRAMALTAN